MGDSSGPSWSNVDEQAYKAYLGLLSAALLDEHFEQPVGVGLLM
ncbi:MAG: hypothetical protein RL042_1370 [Nitrospirota bacterium]|jgi:hypothetical protein